MTLLRRRLLRRDEDFYTVLYALAVLAFGGDPIWESEHVEGNEPSPRELVARAIGIERALTDKFDDRPWLSDDPDTPALLRRLRDHGAFEVLEPERLIRETSDEELYAARDRARVIITALPLFSAAVEAFLGRDAGGLGIFSVMSQHTRAGVRAFIVRYCIIVPALLESDGFLELETALSEYKPQLRLIAEAGGLVSRYREALTSQGTSSEGVAHEELDALHVELQQIANDPRFQSLARGPGVNKR